ncbi:hypothetical protein [Paenibacillus wynnii]|uniref:hypothetical protein n=1 Tax=Paenibacillus wynnii TaxID=268407 RepID=UPI0012F7909A|nr:hypothetical protein [Paenibacillus wynnii]
MMLDDTPRKLLRIMYHYSGHFKRLPTMPEMERLSGRTPVAIRKGLLELADQNYISWNPHTTIETAVIIEGWEREDTTSERYQATHRSFQTGNLDYWQYY